LEEEEYEYECDEEDLGFEDGDTVEQIHGEDDDEEENESQDEARYEDENGDGDGDEDADMDCEEVDNCDYWAALPTHVEIAAPVNLGGHSAAEDPEDDEGASYVWHWTHVLRVSRSPFPYSKTVLTAPRMHP
jgi:hypothetical protein